MWIHIWTLIDLDRLVQLIAVSLRQAFIIYAKLLAALSFLVNEF